MASVFAWASALSGQRTRTSVRTDRIDQRLAVEADEVRDDLRGLLLGAPESGKSTLVKHARMLFGARLTRQERLAYVGAVHAHALGSMKTLLRRRAVGAGAGAGAGERSGAGAPEATSAASTAAAASGAAHQAGRCAAVLAHPDDARMTPEVGRAVQELWGSADEALTATYAQRRRFRLSDSAPHFFARASAIAAQDYVPTDEDILRVRERTSGVSETPLVIHRKKTLIIDVGGQRSEREKWVAHFSGVAAVVFVANIAEFDELVDGDPARNRLVETLALFHWVADHPAFRHAALVLLLNKTDLFEEKLRSTSLRLSGGGEERFTDFVEEVQTPEKALAYLVKKFRLMASHRINAGSGSGLEFDRIRIHDICALSDKKKFTRVLRDVVAYATDDALTDSLNPQRDEPDDA
jgi:GTPase SAR1 family protein